MGTSIAAGVRASPDSAGWLVLPGDMPLVQPATLLAVARALDTIRSPTPSTAAGAAIRSASRPSSTRSSPS